MRLHTNIYVFRRKCGFSLVTFSKEELSNGTCEETGSHTMYGQKIKQRWFQFLTVFLAGMSSLVILNGSVAFKGNFF